MASEAAEKYRQYALSTRTEDYFHNQYGSLPELAKGMGPNSVAFGIRPLDALHGSAFDADFLADHDLGAYHENVFWTDGDSVVHNFDYSPDGILPDKGFSDNISSYRFSDSYSAGSANMYTATHPDGFSGSNYNFFTHNCQDYSNAVRQNLNIDPWHN